MFRIGSLGDTVILYSAAGRGLINIVENHDYVTRARYLRLRRPRGG